MNLEKMMSCNYLSEYEVDASKIRKKDTHLKADIVELACLKNEDKIIPVSESLIEQMGENEIIGGIDNEEIEEKENIDIEEDCMYKNSIYDIEEHIRSRTKLFGNFYPFDYNKNLISVKSNITIEHKLYTFLLMASHSKLWGNDKFTFREDFEILSAYALKNIVPTWTIKIMGTANSDNFICYQGSRRKKLETFSKDLKLILRMREDELEHYNAPGGDGKLDIIAWYALSDGAVNMPVILGQAGCTEDEDIMFSKFISILTWSNRLEGLSALSCFFTPQHYRNSTSCWIESSRINGVFLDRFRIMSLVLCDKNMQYDQFPSMEIVENIFAS